MAYVKIPLKIKLNLLVIFPVVLVSVIISIIYIRGQLLGLREYEDYFLEKVLEYGENLAQNIRPYLVESNYEGMNNVITDLITHTRVTYALVVDMENKIQMHSDRGRVGRAFDNPMAAKKIKFVEGEGLIQKYYDKNGEEFLEAAYPVKAGELVLGNVRIGMSTEGFQEKKTGMKRTMFFFLFIAFGIGMLSVRWALIVAEGIANALNQLRRQAEAVGKGDYTHKVPIKRNDEIGVLARSFNDMTENLGKADENIRDVNQQLRASEQQLINNNKRLSVFNEAAVDREKKVIELKEEINQLNRELGRPAPYDLSFLPQEKGEEESEG